MKQIDYEALTPAQLDQVNFCESEDQALTKPHECRWVLDDDDLLIGYRRPYMFSHGVTVKWEEAVISLETGNVIPMLDGAELKEPKVARVAKKKFMDVVAEHREAAGIAEAGDGEGERSKRSFDSAQDDKGGDTVWLELRDIAVTTNVRTNWPEEELVEMRDNFRRRGFLAEVSRLLVRPRFAESEGVPAGEPGFELVLGGRRYRSASDVGISPVPCVARRMSDSEMLILQLIENIKRKGLTPLDEAEGICRLLDEKKPDGTNLHTVESLAQELDCSPTHISRCRGLRRLRGTPAGEAVDSRALSIHHGELLARVFDPVKRDELTARIMKTSDGRGALPREVLSQWIKDEVMIQLRGLEFDPDDQTLVPPQMDGEERLWGGDCETCPRNSKQCGDDGRDARAVPMCTFPGCFRLKVEAAEQIWKATMQAKGCKVLSHEEAAKIIDGSTGTRLAANSGYVELVDTPAAWEVRDDVTSPPPWNKMIKGQGMQTTVFKDTKGTVHEVVERDLAIRAAVANGKDIFKPSEKAAKTEEATAPEDAGSIPSVERAAEAERRAEKLLETSREQVRQEHRASTIARAEFDAVVANAAGTKVPEGFWVLAIDSVLRVLNEQGDLEFFAQRHGFDGDADHALDWLRKKVTKLEAPFRLSFLVEALIALYMELEAQTELPKWAKVFGVDLKKVRKTTDKLLDAEEEKAEEEAEIANGVVWSGEKKGIEFEWEGAAVKNPDVASLDIPSRKFVANVTVAHSVKGWVMGFLVAGPVKKGLRKEQVCVNNGTHYNSRATAFRTGLVAVRSSLGELGAPPQDCERVEAYIAAVEEKPSKKKGSGK